MYGNVWKLKPYVVDGAGAQQRASELQPPTMARSEPVFAVLSPLRNIENLVDVVLLMEQMPKDMTTLDRG